MSIRSCLLAISVLLPLIVAGCGGDPLETAKDALEPLRLKGLADEYRMNEDEAATTTAFLEIVDAHWSSNPGEFLTRLEEAREKLAGAVNTADDDPKGKRAAVILAAMTTAREIVTGYAERAALRRSTEAFGAYNTLKAAGEDVLETKAFYRAYLSDTDTRRLYAIAMSEKLCAAYRGNRNRLASDPVFQGQVDQFAAERFNQDADAALSRKRYGKRAYFSGLGILPAYAPATANFAETPTTFVAISAYNTARSIQGRELGTDFDLSCKPAAAGMVCTTSYIDLASELKGCTFPKPFRFRVSAELLDPKGLLKDTRIELAADRAQANALSFVTRSVDRVEVSGYGMIVEAYTSPMKGFRIDREKYEIVVTYDIEKLALFTRRADASNFLGLLAEPATLRLR